MRKEKRRGGIEEDEGQHGRMEKGVGRKGNRGRVEGDEVVTGIFLCLYI